jgi:glycolate oxidase iron-sulfur subunit
MSDTLSQLITEADRCVACGLCLPYCPTYQKTGSEADSPRGRIQLMRAVAQDILPNNDRFKAHIDLCLSCRSCESVCPNNVQYGKLADITRALFIPKKYWQYSLAKSLIASRSFQYIVGNLLWLAQTLKVQPLLGRMMPIMRKLNLITRPTHWKKTYYAQQPNSFQNPHKTVQLFLGCASNVFDQQALKATVFVCQHLGIDVIIAPSQSCCGSIARQMGDASTAQSLTLTNQQAFDPNIPIISVASGCSAGLKDYLPKHKVIDIHTFLAECDWSNVQIVPANMTIYVQDPCSLRNTLNGAQAVYTLLNRIPQARVLPLAHNAQCCGGAGAYMLTQPEMANALLQDKITSIKENDVAVLATANIGCALHIAHGLREQNQHVTVLHPMVIVAKQMGFTL